MSNLAKNLTIHRASDKTGTGEVGVDGGISNSREYPGHKYFKSLNKLLKSERKKSFWFNS